MVRRPTTPQIERIDQLEAMRMGMVYRFMVRCRDFSVELRPLSIAESNEVTGRVMERLSKLPESQRNRMQEHTLLALETLELASSDPDTGKAPSLTSYIMSKMTPDEVQFIFKQYVAECDRVCPCLDLISGEELTKLVEDLKKSPREELALRLTELSLSHLVSVSRSLILGE